MSKRRHKTSPPTAAPATPIVEAKKPSRWFTSQSLVVLALVAITLAVYWPVTRFEFINYDDHDYVTENYHVLGGLTASGLKWAFLTGHASNWHPLTWLSHMLDCQLFGPRPGWHHLVNALFHAANAALVFALFRKLTGATWRPAFVAVWFALHPLHVESVAWVSERKDVLSAFFGLLTLIFYARYVETDARNSKKKTAPYAVALLFFALGLLSKPMLVTWPFVMLLLDVWPLKRFPTGDWRLAMGKMVREKIPFFALSAASCVITFVAQKKGGAVGSLQGLSLEVRGENAIVAYARYLGKTFWPVDLANPYPHPGDWPVMPVVLAAALVVSLSGLAIWLVRSHPYVFTGWFWFVGALVPVIGIVQVGTQSMADRYTYLPLVGIFLIIAWAGSELITRWPALKNIFAGGAIAVLALGSYRTSEQLALWRNSEKLARHTIAVTKNNTVAYTNLGNSLLEQGQLEEAIANLRQALYCARGKTGVALDPAADLDSQSLDLDQRTKNTSAEILNNIGTALARQGRAEAALNYYRAALRANPQHVLALHNLGHELISRKQYPEAIQSLEAAVRLRPDDPDIYCTLGDAFFSAGRQREAMAQYALALRLSPQHAPAHRSFGNALMEAGRIEEALRHFEAALQADPKFIENYNNLGSALMRLGRYDDAMVQFRKLLQLMPDHPRARDNYGIALASLGRLDDAVVEFRAAIRLDPTNAQMFFNLGNVQALQGKPTEAEATYREALRRDPTLAPAHCNLGGVLLELGRREEGIAQFKEALRHDPDYAPAKEQLRAAGITVP